MGPEWITVEQRPAQNDDVIVGWESYPGAWEPARFVDGTFRYLNGGGVVRPLPTHYRPLPPRSEPPDALQVLRPPRPKRPPDTHPTVGEGLSPARVVQILDTMGSGVTQTEIVALANEVMWRRPQCRR